MHNPSLVLELSSLARRMALGTLEDQPMKHSPFDTDLPMLVQVLQRYEGVDPHLVLLDEPTAAACLEQKPKTFESWRRDAKELPFLKIGRNVRYRLSDILNWLERNTFRSSREAKTRNRSAPTGRARRSGSVAPNTKSVKEG
jgi:hypothetical protein